MAQLAAGAGWLERLFTRVATWASSVAVEVRWLSIRACGAAGSVSSRMLAANASKSASFPASRSHPRAARRWRRVAASDRIHTRCTVSPPSSAAHDCHRRASWIWWVNGPDRTTGQPYDRISRAVAVIPAYSWILMCPSYHGPSRSPAGRPAAASTAATNEPYIVSLSRSAGTGSTVASKMVATVLLPAPGGPATTHTVAGTAMGTEGTEHFNNSRHSGE